MNQIEIFKNEEFGEIRTVLINGEPWFVGKDVCKAFGDTNYRRSLARVDDDEKGVSQITTLGGTQNMTILNESGLYSILFYMQPQKAKGVSQNDSLIEERITKLKKFKHWVTSEVLPTIRKTGGYINNVDLMVNTYFSNIPDTQKTIVRGLLVNIEEKQKKIVSLTNENDLLIQKNLEWADRPLINSLVRAYASSIGDFGKAWNNYKKELLYKYGINLNSRITSYLNTTGRKTKPKTLDMIDDSELANAVSAAVALCKENNVDIEDLINNKSD